MNIYHTKALGVAAAVGALVVAAPAAQAQVTIPTRTILLPTTNTKEINVAANVFLNSDDPFAASASYGLFTSPSFEIGLTGSVAGARHAETNASVGGFADYYFRSAASAASPLVPYIGAFAGYSHAVTGIGSVGGQAGVKYFFNPNVAASLEYQYRSTQHSNGNNEIVLGFSTFFH
jgi:opacity protein-like surface antigen